MTQLINPNSPNASTSEQQQMLMFAKILQSAPDMECDACKYKDFKQVYRIKKVSGLMTGTGKDMVVPISLYACSNCGHVNQYFLEKFATEETEEAK